MYECCKLIALLTEFQNKYNILEPFNKYSSYLIIIIKIEW